VKKFHQVQKKQIDSHKIYSESLPLAQIKLASVLATGKLHHRSATAPGCTTQLHNLRGLPLPIKLSSEKVSCNHHHGRIQKLSVGNDRGLGVEHLGGPATVCMTSVWCGSNYLWAYLRPDARC